MPLSTIRLKPRIPTAWLSFDGTDDYVEVADKPEFSSQNLTVEAQICYTGLTEYPIIVSKWDWSHKMREWALAVDSYKYVAIAVYDEEADTLTSVVGTSDIRKRLVHVTGVVDDGNGHIYVDGIKENSLSITQTIRDTAAPLRVGMQADDYWPFEGIIAFVRVYKRALAESEIRYNMLHLNDPVKNGLVLWLSETSINPPTWTDLSGYDNHGTIYGATKIERPLTASRILSAARTQPIAR